MFSSHNSEVQDFSAPKHAEESADKGGGVEAAGDGGGESSSIGQLRNDGVERLTVRWLPAHDDEYLAEHEAGRRILTQALLERCVRLWERVREKGEREIERARARAHEWQRESETQRV